MYINNLVVLRDPSDYGGIDLVRISLDQIWNPGNLEFRIIFQQYSQSKITI